ncbi:hypothetical protein [Aquimarina algiphila]|uniref:Uncharacterized protein n=1 Tax=Aquimarina algiphila TaxID=2047982 RepID=A0A554VF07_9FLAO|nr:hypothetical protein [Aquimarina algiphila]TSE05680.1 hypothetical protein FOF46_21875 [Aquimarina algiphila]
METTILERQNVLDITLQEYGSITAVFDFALGNGLGITSEPGIGEDFILPKSEEYDPDILGYYQNYNIKPVTGSTGGQVSPDDKGIGVMITEQTFIIG